MLLVLGIRLLLLMRIYFFISFCSLAMEKQAYQWADHAFNHFHDEQPAIYHDGIYWKISLYFI